jgi:hypothetical protein
MHNFINICFGDNVWIGARVMILKGAVVPNGSVVGAMAMVNKKFDEEHVLIAGVPAKVVRTNIEWRREDFANSEIIIILFPRGSRCKTNYIINPNIVKGFYHLFKSRTGCTNIIYQKKFLRLNKFRFINLKSI